MIELEQISEAKKSLGIQEGTQLWFEFSKIIEHFYENFNINNASNYKKKLLHFIEEEFKKKFRHVLLLKKAYDLYINFISNGIVGLLDIYLNSSENTEEQEKITLQVSRLLSLYDLI